jgi:aspartate aminotransferase
MSFSANVERLKPSATIAVSTLAKSLVAEGRDIVNLGAGEPDFDTPLFIADAAVHGVRSGRTRYTPPAGLPELRKAIANHLAARSGREINWQGVVVSAGVKQALFNTFFSLCGPGDEVLVAAPYWTTYPDLVMLARAEPVTVFGAEANSFKVVPSDLARVVSENTKGLVLNTPCNPTGAVYSLEELKELSAWAKGRGVWIVSDEIYRNVYFGEEAGAAPGILDLPEADVGNFILVDGASKSYAMTGWRVGFSYSSVEVAQKFSALQSQITSNTATPSQVAALEAFRNVEAASSAIAEMGVAFRRRRDLVITLMDQLLPGVPYLRPEGAFYLYFRVDGLLEADEGDATAWCSRLLQEHGVALVPGAAFGDDRWVRLSFAAADALIEEAFERIVAMIRTGAAV